MTIDPDAAPGRPRPAVAAMPSYRPGKGAAQAEQEHGITGAIKLASNENPAPPIQPIIDAITAAARNANRYADHRATELRATLADHLGVDPARVTVGNGSVGLLQQIALSYLDPGDAVVYPWRSFEVYPVYARLLAARPVEVPLAVDLGVDWGAMVDAVRANDPKLVFIATPNNPTGVAATTAELSEFVSQVPASTIVVIDEAYREFLDPGFGDPVRELIAAEPGFDNVVVTRTMSKAHGLAGVRVGYAVGHPDVIATIDKTLAPFAVSGLAQAAALAALENLDAIGHAVDEVLAERARVEVELRASGWELPRTQANFVWLATGDQTDDIAVALERTGVVVRPFSGEGIRVTIGSAAENDRFLTAFRDVT